MDKNLELLDKILEKKTIKEVSENLNLASGTVKRWTELRNVPLSYHFELLKLSDIKIDYSIFSYKEKDQFFTPEKTAKYCYKKFLEILDKYKENEEDYTYIEPSAGSGNFLKVLPTERTIAIDIEPLRDTIIEGDFLKWKPENNGKKYIVFGNPPFGLRGQMALKFINHSYDFSEYVCFILPQLFESDGKGVPRKRVHGFNLIHSSKIDNIFLEPSGKEIKINCIFQIWSKKHSEDFYKIKEFNTDILDIFSVSDGGTPSTTRNKKMFKKCDVFLPSTCFGKENMKYYHIFEDLPGRKGYGIVFKKDKENNLQKFKKIVWTDAAFLSTNSAYNIRKSQIMILFI